jgi:predicted phosphate transport protein (TIGR00153 family)
MNMFSKSSSPKVTALINEQIKDVEGCLINFENFMRAAVTPETAPETLRSLSTGVHQMENAADRSLRVMIDSLVGGAYLPSTREDLINVATSCDKIANTCESAAKMMVLQKFSFPKEYSADIMDILSHTRVQFTLLAKAIDMLFSKFNAMLQDHSILDDIRAEESKVDAIEEKLYESIFATDLDLAHQTQMAGFVDEICDISDVIENIADKIQIMLITRKA